MAHHNTTATTTNTQEKHQPTTPPHGTGERLCTQKFLFRQRIGW